MEALPTLDSNGNPVPYLSPGEAAEQVIQKRQRDKAWQPLQDRQDQTAGGAPSTPSGSKLLPLDDEDYVKILKEASIEDVEKLNLSDAELSFLHAKAMGSQHGSALAKHRWEQSYEAKQRLTTQPPTTMPTPEGDLRYNELVGNEIKPPIDVPQILSRIEQSPPHAGGLATSDLPTVQPYSAQEEPNPNTRLAKNIGVGVANAVPGTVNFLGNAVLHPMETAKALVPQLAAVVKAGAWEKAEELLPGLGGVLSKYGINPDQAVEMFTQDPVAFTATVLGAAKGVASLGAKVGPPAPTEAPTAAPIPEPAAPVPIERRIGTERAQITQQATDILKDRKLPEAMDEIYRQKSVGEINPAQESALLREVQKQHSEAVAGPGTSQEPTGRGLSQEEMAELDIARAQMEANEIRPPDPPTASAGGGGVFAGAADDFMRNQIQQTETMAAITEKVAAAVDMLKPQPFSTKGMSKPLFYKEAQVMPDVVEAAYKKMAAKGDVEGALGLLYDRGFHEILTNPSERALFGHWQLAEQAKAIRDGFLMQAKSAPDTATAAALMDKARQVDIPGLKPGEAEAMASNPQIVLAQQFYKAKIEPELEGWADPAKIPNRRQAEGGYAKVVPVTANSEPTLGTWVVDAEGNRFPYTRAVRDANRADWEAQGLRPRKGGGGRRFGPFRKQTAQAAKRASGRGKMWVIEPREVTNQGLLDRLPKARHNQFIDVVRRYKVSEEDAKRGVTDFKGHDVPVAQVAVQPLTHILDETGEQVHSIPETISVPKPVADTYNAALKPWSMDIKPEWAAIVRAQTQLRLIGVAEALGHIYSVTDRMTMQPGLGGKYGPLVELLANEPSGLAAKLLSVLEVYDQHGPAFENNIRELTTQGRTRAFNLAGQSIEATSKIGKMADLVANPLKKATFGFPKPAKRGFYGYETRLKSAMQDIIKREEPEMEQAELTARLNNEFATYVADMQPQLVKILRNIPILGDAFAAAGVAMTKGAVRSLVGSSALPMTAARRTTILWRATAPIIFWGYIINKALDPEHRSPFRKGGPGLGNIRVHQDNGKTVDLPINYLAPAARGLKVFGGFDTINDIARGKGDAESVTVNALRGMTNTALRLGVGAAGQDLGVLVSGKVPYITPSNDLLQVAELSPEHQLRAKFQAMLTQAVAGVEGQTDISTSAYKPGTVGMQYLARAAALAARPIKFGAPETTLEYIDTAGQFAKVKEATEKQVNKLSGFNEGQQDIQFKKWLDANVAPEMQQYSHNVFVKKRAMRRHTTTPAQ